MVRIKLQRFLKVALSVVAFGVLVGILFYNMAVVNWGLLAKSEIDPEKIEEAIARLIAEHEADPDSHLGEGEALQSHRASEIIDHVIGSVLADKTSFTEIINESSFETLDSWYTQGQVSIVAFGIVSLFVDYPDIQNSLLASSLYHSGGWINYDKEMILQFSGWITDPVYPYFWATLGKNPTENNFEGFGFYILQGVIKGVWGKGANPTFTGDLGIDPTISHIYRVHYVASEKSMNFYIDGIILATISDIEPAGPPEQGVEIRAHALDGTVEAQFNINKLMISRQI